MTMREKQFTSEIALQVKALRTLITSEEVTRPRLLLAWETYYSIKVTTATDAPIDEVNLIHIREFMRAMYTGEPRLLNSTFSAAIFGLKLDTVGLVEPGSYLKGANPQEMKNARKFVDKMGKVISGSPQV